MRGKGRAARLLATIMASSRLYMLVRVGGFVVIAIVPAIAAKWAFHELTGLRLDGAVGSWLTIW